MELISHFDRFLSNIEPPLTYINEASVGHTTLRRRLISDDAIKDYIQDTFLSGSYARNTAVTPIKDVDVIITLNLDKQRNSPMNVLNYLHRTLRKYYPGKTIKQRRSIKVALKYIRMDVVPGIPSNGTNSPIYIPDRLLQRWILTHPKGHNQLATKLNEKNEDLFVPLVKAIKWWRNNKILKEARPKSIVMEAILTKTVNKYRINSIPTGILLFFKYVIDNYGVYFLFNIVPIIDDPVLQRNNVAIGWSVSDFTNFIMKTKKSYQIALKALNSPRKTESIGLWRVLLGSKFPSNV